jgi:hypothetical protein
MTNGYVNIFLPGRTIITRLHEHGPGEGYFDGKLVDMKALSECGYRIVELWNDGKMEKILVDVVWLGLDDQSYDDYDHAVVHLNWKE